VVYAAPREASDVDGEPEIAHRVARLLQHDFGVVEDAEVRLRLGIALEIGASLIHRAFVRDADGDPRYLDEAYGVVRDYLDRHLAERLATTSAA
jgi:hypothetical protein